MIHPEILAVAGLASGWMILWAAAGAIPIVIHLLARRRQVTIRWAAMQMLLEVVEKEAKRVRIEQLLILLIRIFILLTLAFALAQPFFSRDEPSLASLGGPDPRLWIIGIDASYSMGYQDNGLMRFEAARKKAMEIVKSSQQGDAFALLEFAEPCRTVIRRPTFDPQSVLGALRRLKTLDTGCDIPSCLLRVQEIVAEANQTDGMPKDIRVIILSDLGLDSWESVLSGSGRRTFETLANQSSLQVIPFTSNAPNNLAIRSLRPSTHRVIAGQALEVTVDVENFSSRDALRVPVQLAIDDKTVQSEYVDIAANSSRAIQFSVLPKPIGFTVLSASIPSDRLRADDERTRVVEVRQQNHILFVEDKLGDARLIRMSLAPQISLAATNSRGSSPPPMVASRTISSIDLVSVDLGNWDAVVLADTGLIDSSSSSLLTQFVRRGGTLICLFGPRTQMEFWNGTAVDDQLLGFQFDSIATGDDLTVDPLEYNSPVLAPFAGFPDSGLLTTPIFKHWKIRSSGSPRYATDLAFTDGSPLIVRTKLGKGTTASVLSAPESGIRHRSTQAASWNAIAAWPSFVPLMQQLAKTVLDTDGQNYNLHAGQPLHGSLAGPQGVSQITIVRPGGLESQIYTEEMNETSDHPWRFDQTQQRGIYTARGSSGLVVPYAVNVNPIESSLDSIPVSALPLIERSEESSASHADRGAAAAGSDQNDGLARIVLGLLLVLLVSESALAWLVGRRVG